MSENGSIEENVTGNWSVNVEEDVSEIQTLTLEAVNEQIRGSNTPLNRQPEDLTRLVQGMADQTASWSLPQDWFWYHFWYSQISVRQHLYRFWKRNNEKTLTYLRNFCFSVAFYGKFAILCWYNFFKLRTFGHF